MYDENVALLGWVAVPLVAYVGVRLALFRTERRRVRRPALDAEERLAHLRHLRDEGLVIPRGRMTDALRLAEGAGALTTEVRQP